MFLSLVAILILLSYHAILWVILIKKIECFRESIIKFDKILLQLKNSKKIKDNHITFFIYTIYFKVFLKYLAF